MGVSDYEQVFVSSRSEWREWLAANADTSPGIWLVTHKRATGLPAPSYDDVVEEALCFGWVDSTVRTRDELTGMQLVTPRRPRSTWAITNKERVARLTAAGLMTERGLRAVAVAQENGSWSALESVERMDVPEDLAAALAADPIAAGNFKALPPGSVRQHLWWVVSAKRPQTRAQRIAAVVSAAHEGRRAV